MYPDYYLDFSFMPLPDFITKFHAFGGSGTTGEGEGVHEAEGAEGGRNPPYRLFRYPGGPEPEEAKTYNVDKSDPAQQWWHVFSAN